MNAIRLTRRQVGANYENQARRYLEHAGLVFVAANVACRAGELDLVMRDQQTWVFVEVRYRRNANFGGAAASGLRNTMRALTHHLAVLMF
jgi:putative endonuclease